MDVQKHVDSQIVIGSHILSVVVLYCMFIECTDKVHNHIKYKKYNRSKQVKFSWEVSGDKVLRYDTHCSMSNYVSSRFFVTDRHCLLRTKHCHETMLLTMCTQW